LTTLNKSGVQPERKVEGGGETPEEGVKRERCHAEGRDVEGAGKEHQNACERDRGKKKSSLW